MTYIDPDDAVQIETLLQQSGRSKESFCSRFGVKRISLMPQEQFEPACSLIIQDASNRGIELAMPIRNAMLPPEETPKARIEAMIRKIGNSRGGLFADEQGAANV
jgi:hypothetical protein